MRYILNTYESCDTNDNHHLTASKRYGLTISGAEFSQDSPLPLALLWTARNGFLLMATYRPVRSSFWNDPFIEKLSPEAKLVFLFLFTNPSTTESGIYQISPHKIAEYTGIKENICVKILTEDLKGKVTYDSDFYTVFVHAFLKNHGTGRPDLLLKSILSNAKDFRSEKCWTAFVSQYREKYFINEINHLVKGLPRVVKGFANPYIEIELESFKSLEKSAEKNLSAEPTEITPIMEVLNHLNAVCSAHYRTDSTGFIAGRLAEGYTVEDFKRVIDLKTAEWCHDPKMHKFLRPGTLFHPEKFEGYLNEHPAPKPLPAKAVR